MTPRERVIASRLVQKIDAHEEYAKRIGLSYKLSMATVNKNAKKSV